MSQHRLLGVMAIAACTSVATATPGHAGQQAPVSRGAAITPGSSLNLQPRRQSPRLFFDASQLLELRRLQSRAQMSERRVMCGMTLLPGDAGLDLGIQARLSPGAVRPTMRAVEPPLCSGSRTAR